MTYDYCIIGAGLTGLSLAYKLKKEGKNFILLEREKRVGGLIKTHTEKGFTFESGPNTGVISNSVVSKLFDELKERGLKVDTASSTAKVRWIYKRGKFYTLPTNPIDGLFTPLFSLKDKFSILLESFRPKGTNPDESIADLVKRRLGTSYLQYAVEPFISAIYAGLPDKIITRYALPKLYQLEQEHGSFIRGAIAKKKIKKTKEEKLATKEIFSIRGGLERLVNILEREVGKENILLSLNDLTVSQSENLYIINSPNLSEEIHCKNLITAIGATSLPTTLPFIDKGLMQGITSVRYAPVVQVSVGFTVLDNSKYKAYGALVPISEDKDVLGILFPSVCFKDRAPKGGMLFSIFLGGMRNPDLINYSDEEIIKAVDRTLYTMLKIPKDKKPDLIRIFKHRYAIPQYELSTGLRIESIKKAEELYKSLHILGGIKDGIGMADRIKQDIKK